MATESSVCLVKNDQFQVLTDSVPFPVTIYCGKDVRLTAPHYQEGEDLTVGSSYVQAISDYIHEPAIQKQEFLCLLTLNDNMKSQLDFYVYLYKSRVERLCSILPKPFLHLTLTVSDPANHVDRATFEKRLSLTDVLEKLNQNGNVSGMSGCRFKLFSTTNSIDRNALCDIRLCWTEPDKIEPIRIGMGPLLQNLYGRESSKDLRIVVGDGAEVKCHRVIFEAHGDVLSAMLSPTNGMKESVMGLVEMKENSGKGLYLLVRYLYGLALTQDDLNSVDLTVELFKTANKYLLANLEKSLGQLLLQKGKEWFTPDGLVELYFHVRNLREWKGLEDRALNMMISLSKDVKSCERFKELNPADALALVWKLLELEKESKADSVSTPAKRKRDHFEEAESNN